MHVPSSIIFCKNTTIIDQNIFVIQEQQELTKPMSRGEGSAWKTPPVTPNQESRQSSQQSQVGSHLS